MSLSKIEKRVNEQTISRARQLESIQSQINAAHAIVEKAAAELSQAQEAGDSKAYGKAASEHRTAKDVLEMYEKQLAKVNASPVITLDEYKAFKGEIFQTMDQINQETTDGFMEAMEIIQTLHENHVSAINTANQLLHQVQRELYKMPLDIEKLENGRKVTTRTMEDTYRYPAIYGTLSRMLMNDYYNSMKENK